MEDYVNLRILGRGARGELTKKVSSKYNQKLYVIKELGQDKLTENQKKVLKILVKNECPYIVRHYLPESDETKIKTDYINDVDLLDYTNTYMDLGKPIEEKTLWKLLLQCSGAIKYLHENKIIHRNIRLENFYMTDDKDIKLGNFKYATIMSENDDNEDLNFPEGGMLYKSEKTLNNSVYDQRSDIYSLGVLFHKMSFFEFPYEPICNAANGGEFKLKKFSEAKNFDSYSELLKNIIKKMLEEENLTINTIYEEALKIYNIIYVKNSSIKSTFACISSCGIFVRSINSILQDKNKIKISEYPVITYYSYLSKYFQQNKEEKEDKENVKANFNKAIKYFKTLMDNYYSLKIDEEPKPIDIINIFLDKFTKEVKNTKNEDVIKDLNDYIRGNFNSLGKEFVFNYFKLNIDKCEKDKDKNEYDLSSIMQKEWNKKYKSPTYLIIIIERDQYSYNKTTIKIPSHVIFGVDYLLCAYLNKNFKNEELYFNAVYSTEKGKNLFEWFILEGDSIHKIEGNVFEKSYGTPEILIFKPIKH